MTAEDYVKKAYGSDIDNHTKATLVASYKKYAAQVAIKALKDASDRASIGTLTDDGTPFSHKIIIEIVRRNIRHTKIKSP